MLLVYFVSAFRISSVTMGSNPIRFYKQSLPIVSDSIFLYFLWKQLKHAADPFISLKFQFKTI